MVVSTLLHNAVYSNFFLSCWTNNVEDFPKWQCSQYLTLNPTCILGMCGRLRELFLAF